MKTLKVNLIKQKGRNNCWAACLSMALDILGLRRTEGELAKNYPAGLSLDEVCTNFSSLFKGTDYRSPLCEKDPKIDFDTIKKFIDEGKPILIGMQNYNGHLAHTLLIYGYDPNTNKIAIADPWTGKSITISYLSLTEMDWVETLILS
jgi:uncharacterized protein YvpB